MPYRRGMLTIAFSSTAGAMVEVAVFDLAGRRVKTVAGGRFGDGLSADSRDSRRRALSHYQRLRGKTIMG